MKKAVESRGDRKPDPDRCTVCGKLASTCGCSAGAKAGYRTMSEISSGIRERIPQVIARVTEQVRLKVADQLARAEDDHRTEARIQGRVRELRRRR